MPRKLISRNLPAVRYGGAVAAAGAGLVVRLALEAWVGPGLPTYITFYPAVMAAALLGGLGPGLVATAASALEAVYWVIPPAGFAIEKPVDAVGLVFFSGMGLFMSVVAEYLRRTGRKAAAYDRERALRETRREKEFLAHVIERASQPFAVGYPDGRLGLFNPAFAELTGYSAEELRAMDWATTLTPPEWREPERHKLEELHLTGQPVRYEKEYLRKDGTRVPIELLVHLVRDAAGKPEYYYSFLADITARKRAGEALRESERQFRTLADSIPNLAWWANSDGYITWYNQRWYEYTGTTPQQMEGWGWQSVHDPQALPAVMERWKASLGTGQPFDMTFPLRGADGVFRPFLTRVMPLKDAQGRVQQWFGTNTDVSEAQRTEEAMRDLNAQLEQRLTQLQTANEAVQVSRRAALSLAEDALEARKEAERVNAELQKVNESLSASHRGALNVMEDALRARKQAERANAEQRNAAEQRRLALEAADLGAWDYHFQTGEVSWDERCREMWGIVDLDHVDYSAAISRIHPDDRAATDAAVNEALSGHGGGAYHREFRVVWPDGSVHWISSHGRVYFQGEGAERRPVRFTGANREITAERAVQDALRESEERLAGFAAASFEGIVLSDAGRILDCNEQLAQMLGFTVQELKGRTLAELFAPEDRERVSENISAGRESFTEHQMVRRDGTRITVEAHGRPRDPSRLSLRHTAIRDITERKQREELLNQLNRTLKALKDSSQAMLRAASETEYLEEVCKIIGEDCGHAMVWVGFAEHDRARSVRPIAYAGFEEGYLKALRVTWADTERGRGPTGTAIRTGKPCGCANMLTDARFAPWRAEALKRGYISSLALPLLAGGKAFGAITIYSNHPDPFSEDERKLLTDLADDVSYCIATLRARAGQALAEERLHELNQELEDRVRQRTAEVEASEARYRSLVTASAQIVWITNTEGQIVRELPGWEAFTGQTFDRYRGLGWAEAVHPDDRARARAAWQQAVATHSAYETEYRLHRHDGQYRHVRARGVPVRQPDRSISEWVGTCTDITIAKEAERRREFTSQLLALFARKNTISDYLNAVVDIIRRWSGCQALGIRILNDLGEIPYESWAGFEPGFLELERNLSLEHHDGCLCIRAVAGKLEQPDRRLLTPGGSFRSDDAIAFLNALSPAERPHYRGNCMKFGFASLAVVPVRYRDQIIGAIHLADRRPGQFPPVAVEFIEAMTPLIGEAILRFQTEIELARHRDNLEVMVRKRTDELIATNAKLESEIAERRRAQDALQRTADDLARSNHDLEQFAYVASHDLQEPLRAVGGYVKLLEHRFPEKLDAKAREYVAGAVDGARRMERLIRDLLAFSRVGTQGQAPALTELDHCLDDAFKNLHGSLQAAHASVLRDPLPQLKVDGTQMVQLFQNLIGNALKFCSERPPEIRIGARQESGRWVLWVGDNGIGIEPQYFERIFQIFQRLHTRTAYPGTGIGLAICKKIVERHGGTIWVESQLGQGATFYFSIPSEGENSPDAVGASRP